MLRLLPCLFFLTTILLKAQHTSTSPFCAYLFNEKRYEELALYTHTILQSAIPAQEEEELKTYLIKSRLKLNPLDSSVLSIPTQSAQCFYLKIYHLLQSNRLEQIHTYLSLHPPFTQTIDTLFIQHFLWLKTHQFEASKTHLQSFPDSLLSIQGKIIKTELLAIHAQKEAQKPKSPLKSILLSAILPGYGKKYVGYKGEAVSALLTNGILGIVFAESIWRKGLTSIYTIGSGSLFLTFYLSNLVGSYYAVKRQQIQNDRFIDAELTKVISLWATPLFYP